MQLRQTSRVGALALLVCLGVLPGTAPAQEAATAPGTVAGKVLDSSSGETIIEAGVEVIGVGKKVRTDLDGKYKINLPPGKYELRFFAPLYQGARLQNVVVQSGQTTNGDASLSPQGQAAMQVVEVVAQADKAAESTQLVQRKSAAVVSDNVSAESIKKSTGSSAADVVARIPAVTVKDSKFLVVRGLNERYTSALLNGSRLPSTDPDKRVVPLDLFPSTFIESLSLIKTFSPDLPGDFAGGLANITLRDPPETLTYSVGLNTNVNTQTTFKSFNTYEGNGLSEHFGFGASQRALPGNFPGSLKNSPAAQRQAYGRSLHNIWTPDKQYAVPGAGMNFSIGKGWGPFGAQLSGLYSNEYKTRNHQLERQLRNRGSTESPEIYVSDDFSYDQDIYETRLAGVLTSSYKLADDHKFSLRSFVNRSTTDETLVGRGTIEQGTSDGRGVSKLQFKEDRLAFGQLGGDHHWSALDVNWRSAFSQTTMDQPDTRIVSRDGIFVSPYGTYSNDGQGGSRFYADLEETLSDSSIDFTLPFRMYVPYTEYGSGLPAKFKFGPAYAYRERDFNLRRFQFTRGNVDLLEGGAATLDRPTEEVLAPQNIGQFNGIDFVEETLPSDSFSATHEILAGYGMFDLPIFGGWTTEGGGRAHQVRLISGVRTEYSYIVLDTVDQQDAPYNPAKNTLDVLPAVNLVYSPRDDMNIRFGFSQAVTRPEFRELAPVQYPEVRGLRPRRGNPDLVQAETDNIDLRWEWFFSPNEIVSLSFFYKDITNAIEQVAEGSGSNSVDSFGNADSGSLTGFEFEARKTMDFLSPSLAGLSFNTNVTYVDSEVTLGDGTVDRPRVSTNKKRELQGTSPFVVNAGVEYQHPIPGTMRLQYNTSDRRIDKVGTFGLPDLYEERRDDLNFVLTRPIEIFGTPLSLKFAIDNILNDNYLLTQGDTLQRRYRTGVKFGLGISYAYN